MTVPMIGVPMPNTGVRIDDHGFDIDHDVRVCCPECQKMSGPCWARRFR
jgi:hypothetical protein